MKKLLFILLIIFVLTVVSCSGEYSFEESLHQESVVDKCQFIKHPQNATYELYSENQKLSAEITTEYPVSVVFTWYRRNPGESEYSAIYTSDETIIKANDTYTSVITLPQNNYVQSDYYCNAIITKDEHLKSINSDSCQVVQVINTGLPTVIINTQERKELVNKDDKVKSVIKIIDKDQQLLLEDTDTTFSGRGNTTWGQAKKPYKIKLSEKASVLGMPKHKQWMLIANYLDMSFMKNEMAFFLSEKLNMDWTVHGKFVNLVKNDEYLGLYWIGEQIKVDKNRVDIDEDNDYLIEMDVYYDETWKFKSSIKGLPYLIKNDDSMDEGRLNNLSGKIADLENILYSEYFPYSDSNKNLLDETYLKKIDVESMAKFYIVNEIMRNGELGHPKSCYFTFDNTKNILKAGPVWDFDYAAYTTDTTLICTNSIYFDALFKTQEFNIALNELISTINDNMVSGKITELSGEIEKGVNLDGVRWGTSNRNPVGIAQSNWEAYVEDLENCVISRLNYIKNKNFEPGV